MELELRRGRVRLAMGFGRECSVGSGLGKREPREPGAEAPGLARWVDVIGWVIVILSREEDDRNPGK